MKRSRLLLVVIVVAVAAFVPALWVNEGPLWRWVMLIEKPYHGNSSGHETRGAVFRHRWSSEIFFAHSYYVESGYLAFVRRKVGNETHTTNWSLDGRVFKQWIFGLSVQERCEPPWLWGVTDQTEPTAPWWDEEKATREKNHSRTKAF